MMPTKLIYGVGVNDKPAVAVPEAWSFGEDNDGWYVERDGVQMIYGLRKDQANLVCDLLNTAPSHSQQSAEKVFSPSDADKIIDSLAFTMNPDPDRCPSHESEQSNQQTEGE